MPKVMIQKVIPFLVIVIAACNTVPPTNVHQPMSARPEVRAAVPVANGSIYQAANSRPLFEDRRARFVGDTITVKITENPRATKSASNKLDRSGTQTGQITSFAGLPVAGLSGLSLNGTSTTSFSGKGEAANNATFSGNITVTVIDVLPNGNLLVSGEKQISIGAEQEFVRVSGVVNPAFVDFSNSVESAKIADARIEYKSSGQLADGQVMGWLARFFLSFLPF